MMLNFFPPMYVLQYVASPIYYWPVYFILTSILYMYITDYHSDVH